MGLFAMLPPYKVVAVLGHQEVARLRDEEVHDGQAAHTSAPAAPKRKVKLAEG
jgi:hypothetical protein